MRVILKSDQLTFFERTIRKAVDKAGGSQALHIALSLAPFLAAATCATLALSYFP